MKIFAIVPCMGRLHHIRRTAPPLVFGGKIEYVLSDYDCPDKTGQWVERAFPNAHVVRSVAERQGAKSIFKKVEALNAGARHAIELGAEYLCFLDADTIVNPGFHDWVEANASYGRFLCTVTNTRLHPKTAQTSGFLCVHKNHFIRAGMFDTRMVGWGGEDMDMRIRLATAGGLDWRYIPLDLIEPITHNDHERIRFHVTQNRDVTNSRNLNFTVEFFKEWSGHYPKDIINTELGKKFYELMGIDRSRCLGYVADR